MAADSNATNAATTEIDPATGAAVVSPRKGRVEVGATNGYLGA